MIITSRIVSENPNTPLINLNSLFMTHLSPKKILIAVVRTNKINMQKDIEITKLYFNATRNMAIVENSIP